VPKPFDKSGFGGLKIEPVFIDENGGGGAGHVAGQRRRDDGRRPSSQGRGELKTERCAAVARACRTVREK